MNRMNSLEMITVAFFLPAMAKFLTYWSTTDFRFCLFVTYMTIIFPINPNIIMTK